MNRNPWLLFALILVVGCSSEDDGPVDPGGGDDPGLVPDVGTISGVVSRSGGFVVAGAAVEAGGVTVATNDDGYFILTRVPEGETVVSISADDLVDTYRVVDVVAGSSLHFADIVLVPFETGLVNGATGGLVATSDNRGVVEFHANSFVDLNGALYAGQVIVHLAVLLPGDVDFYGAFPGRYQGVHANGVEVPLVSHGILAVELFTAELAPLRLANGATATLRLTLSEAQAVDAPSALPMWFFDAQSGDWREEGAAAFEPDDRVYTATVTHFSFWNWGQPIEEICSITGRVLTPAGQPVIGARVVSRSVEFAMRAESITDNDGRFTVAAVRNGRTDVWALGGSLVSDPIRVPVGEDCPVIMPDPLILTVPSFAISLTWGIAPEDVDSHLLIPMTWDPAYDYYHIAFFNMGTLDGVPYTALDTDDITSWGPELITGTRMYEGRSQYWVHNFSDRTVEGETPAGTDNLRPSRASVQLEIGGSLFIYEVADVPIDGADPNGWWHVFDLVVEGGVISVQPVMRFQPRFSDDGVYANEKAGAGK